MLCHGELYLDYFSHTAFSILPSICTFYPESDIFHLLVSYIEPSPNPFNKFQLLGAILSVYRSYSEFQSFKTEFFRQAGAFHVELAYETLSEVLQRNTPSA